MGFRMQATREEACFAMMPELGTPDAFEVEGENLGSWAEVAEAAKAEETKKEAWKEVRGASKADKCKGKGRRRKTAVPVQVALPDLPTERPMGSARMEALRLRIRAKQA